MLWKGTGLICEFRLLLEWTDLILCENSCWINLRIYNRVNGCNSVRSKSRPRGYRSFSPLVIGSMAATSPPKNDRSPAIFFQSPCHRVNGCNGGSVQNIFPHKQLSVPLSSGQWLQLNHNTHEQES